MRSPNVKHCGAGNLLQVAGAGRNVAYELIRDIKPPRGATADPLRSAPAMLLQYVYAAAFRDAWPEPDSRAVGNVHG